MSRLFALCLVVLTLVACAAGTDQQQGDQITGTLVGIDANGADFRSITVEHGSDSTEILIKEGYDYGFDLAHLYEHLEKHLPVRVTIERKDGRPYALAIDDA